MNNLTALWLSTAIKYPEKTALSDGSVTLSFRQADAIARCWAADILQALPAGEEGGAPHPVLVAAERDVSSVLRCLAVLMAGHFYVPYDPEMTSEKLSHIVSDCAPPLALGEEKHREKLAAAGFGGALLSLLAESDPEEKAIPEDSSLPGLQTSPETPAYMIYTSGSTGRPKGVLKSHGAMLYFIQAFKERFSLGSEEVIGNQTPFFFDASAKDIYLMAAAGATLEIIPPEKFVMPVTLIEYLNERKITYVCWVPTALALVTQLRTFEVVKPATLRKVFFVGEVFPLKQLRKWFETLPGIEYVNLYGSTEVAGISSAHVITADTLSDDTLPLGEALPGTRMLLISEGQEIREAGQVGEIAIESPALALEYYHDPERTNKCFLTCDGPDGQPVRRLMTGDMAAFDEAGQLHFLARADSQIKHMGRRIELGEIEAGAEKLSEIVRCCCLYDNNKKKIVLFAELMPGVTRTGKEIRSALKQHLSEYMIPSKVVMMEHLPLNANGKIDRQQLKSTL
ncbi:MAG: amino acid adenylation domain-containing protein [Lachnospiraceae bacterium]|nr:amino acid adenylation domain-containing protein [Lachnospiraceae bacterium]